MIGIVVLSICLFVLSPQQDDVRFAAIQQRYAVLCEEHHLPGLAAGIFENGRIVWFKGYGYADREAEQPVALNTPFRLASLSKPLGAILVMQEIERGRLHLDDPLDSFAGVSERFRGKGILLKHLLTHTSHDLGGSFIYSGAAYDQLTAVLEQVTEKSYTELIHKRFIEPLDLKDCSAGQYLDAYAAVNERLARPYSWIGGKGFIPGSYQRYNASTAAGLIMSVADMAKVDMALDTGMLISTADLATLWTPTVSTTGTVLPYALGWFSQKHGDQWLAWHYGWWDYSSALWLKVPGKHLTLVLLANGVGLSSAFPLGAGDVTVSPFAQAFLDLACLPDEVVQ